MHEKLWQFKQKGADLLAVSVDDAETSRDLLANQGWRLPLLQDTERQACKAFGVHDPGNDVAWPSVFVVRRDGTIAWRHVEATYPERVPVATVLAALDVTPTAN